MPVVGAVGVVGNLGAILILLRPEMRSTFHQSLITLAIVDIIFVITLIVDTQVKVELNWDEYRFWPLSFYFLTKCAIFDGSKTKCRDGIWTSTTRSSSSSSPMCGTPSKIYSWLSKHFSWWVFYIVKLITNSMKKEFVLLWISVRLCVFLSHTETSNLLSTMWCVRPYKPYIIYLIKDFI